MTGSFISDSRRPVLAVRSYAKPYELELSLFAVVVLSGVYIAYEILAEPRGGHPFGHSLGIIGTLLMIMTELLYSLRKRTRLLNWAGPVRYWLSFHIFTGIVGPFMVLMHTGLQFRGLAGIGMLLTAIVVSSGFIGRYLYTALPRTLTGVAASRQEIEAEIQEIQAALYQLQSQKPELVRQLVARLSQPAGQDSPLLMLMGRSLYQWRYRRQLQRALRSLEQLEESQRRQLEVLLARKRELERQIDMLETARRLLRSWHILHIPIGLTLFFSVGIHVAAVLYFRAGLFK
jgi:prefoldin subunit 5